MQSLLTRPQVTSVTATVQSTVTATVAAVQPPTVLRPQGHMNADRVLAFHDQLTRAVMSPTSGSLTVDMSEVESLDSKGLMTLISTLNLAERMNKRFNLCSLSAPARIVLELTQLDRAFEIVEAVAV